MERGWLTATATMGAAADGAAGSDGREEYLLAEAGYTGTRHAKACALFRKYGGGGMMAPQQLKACLAALGCRGDATAYFRAFDFSGNTSWLSLADFVLGCAALDTHTPNEGEWRGVRGGAIFRFYAAAHPAQLLHSELIRLVGDVHRAAGIARGRAEFAQLAADLNPDRAALSIGDFTAKVLSGQLQGTSRLLRYSLLSHFR